MNRAILFGILLLGTLFLMQAVSTLGLAKRIRALERVEWRIVIMTNTEGWAWNEVHKFDKPTNSLPTGVLRFRRP
jgi:hypothetical protein